MPFKEKIAGRIREILSITHKNVEEKKMFGGLCFMVNDKMCIGVETNRLMVRLDPSKMEEVLEKKDANQWTLRQSDDRICFCRNRCFEYKKEIRILDRSCSGV